MTEAHNERINPFHDLYLTEAIGPDSFVKLFSPKFMEQGTSLFQPGNVVLMGLQGSGKTMLLNLLKPEIRLAYHLNEVSFPVPKEFRKFISAGINLRKSGVADFGQLILPESDLQFIKELTLRFGDFFNYWVVNDLIKNIELLCKAENREIAYKSGISFSEDKMNKFSKLLSRSNCWLGGIEPVENCESLKKQLNDRIFHYRNYLNLNITELDSDVRSTKTVIGEPISETADTLKSVGLITDETNVFIRIDQYEELPSLDFSNQNFGYLCQNLIHKALSARSARVSYRVGVRQYAWPETPKIFSTNGHLELKRDYSSINIDEKLRRSENRKLWLFPSLAEDIFERRLKVANYQIRKNTKDLLTYVFGKTLYPKNKAEILVKSEGSRLAIVSKEKNWPKPWTEFIESLALEDPFAAKLADAWVRQKGKIKKELINQKSFSKPFPWDRTYWKKERSDQALTQIASKNKQQMIWQGKDDIIGLSGGNILVFLFICQHIWDSWLRVSRNDKDDSRKLSKDIDIYVQSLGILNASEEWLRKPLEGASSKKRLKFIKTIGVRYYKLLTDDKAMSYPGKNGFSISVKELENNKNLREFLRLAVDYGDLYESSHTSKIKGELRRKYYLAPILCPAFRIPYKHTKEPEYISAKTLEMVLQETEEYSASSSNKSKSISESQQSLFPE